MHKKLFGKVWKWAGKVRSHELQNPDVHLPQDIWPALKQLEGDLKFWLSERELSDEEIAARFHQRLLTIHPFSSGNGRFARILTEHLCNQEGFPIPQWGVCCREKPKLRRKKYVESLTAARRTGNQIHLLEFMYS